MNKHGKPVFDESDSIPLGTKEIDGIIIKDKMYDMLQNQIVVRIIAHAKGTYEEILSIEDSVEWLKDQSSNPEDWQDIIWQYAPNHYKRELIENNIIDL